MPEMPEVETVVKTLNNFIKKKIIKDIEVINKKTLETDEDILKNSLINQEILDVKRVGKYILFIFEDFDLVIHLRMTGRFYFQDLKDVKHLCIKFIFHDKTSLYFVDTRKFARVRLLEKKSDYFKKLGPEYYEISLEYLKNKVKVYKKSLKEFLLDQSIIRGIGNIYANEIAYEARLSPFIRVNTLDDTKINDLYKAINDVLTRAIQAGKPYYNSKDINGLFDYDFKVYGKENKICSRCKGLISKISFKQRGTYYCRRCQNIDD